MSVGRDEHAHEQIARVSSRRRGFPPAGEPEQHTIIDARRNLHFDLVRQKLIAGAVAGETGRFDDRSTAETARAGSNGDELHAFFTFDLLLLSAALTFGAVDRL